METGLHWETCTCVIGWWVGLIPLPITIKCKQCAEECMNGAGCFEVFLLYWWWEMCTWIHDALCPGHSRGSVPTLHFSYLQDTIMSLIVCCSLVQIMRLLLLPFLAHSQICNKCCAAHKAPTKKPDIKHLAPKSPQTPDKRRMCAIILLLTFFH